MEKYFLEKPVRLFCVTADSFPAGIQPAHDKLHALLGSTGERKFYGISWGAGKGKIIYKAAVEELYEGEAAEYNCESFVLGPGNYIGKVISNWKNDETIVAKTFKELLSVQQLLKDGYCVEEYLNENDIRCMVTVQ